MVAFAFSVGAVTLFQDSLRRSIHGPVHYTLHEDEGTAPQALR